MYLFTSTIRSWWSEWVVRAAHCFYAWWRWRSDTLWVTPIRLWLDSSSCYFQRGFVEIYLEYHRYMILQHITALKVQD
jgi:hypothetical protein